MQHRSLANLVALLILVAPHGRILVAQVPVTWDGGNGQWTDPNWTKNGISGQTADATMGNNTGGHGGLSISIGGGAVVENDHSTIGDFRPSMDDVPGGSLTIKEGAVLKLDSHNDVDGIYTRISLDLNLDNGTLRRTFSAPSTTGGKLVFGYKNDLLPNQKININLTHGGRIENVGKMVFGEPGLFGEAGHNPGIEVAMTINNGSLDLTGGGLWSDYFGFVDGDLLFAYEYQDGVGPKNEKYSINFTGPGSITVDPHDDASADAIKGGIYAIRQDSNGDYLPLGGGADLYTPIGYEDLWDIGILQANGQSGLTGATFSNFFSVTGTKSTENYVLTSLLPPLYGDYNDNGKVDAADYVLWRNGGPLQNELDTPNTINVADYSAWRAHYGDATASGSLTSYSQPAGTPGVPEPGSLFLIALGTSAVALSKRYRTRATT